MTDGGDAGGAIAPGRVPGRVGRIGARLGEMRDLRDMFAAAREDEVIRDHPHVAAALNRNKREGLRLAVRARAVALAVTAVLLTSIVPTPELFYYWALLAAFVFVGWLQLRVGRTGHSRAELALLTVDAVLICFTLLVPNPFLTEAWPTAMVLKFDGYKYLFIFIAAVTLGYTWRTILTFGAGLAFVWLIFVVGIALFGTIDADLTGRLREATGSERMLFTLDPSNIQWTSRIEDVAIIMIVTLILSVNAFRMNRLLLAQAEASRERTNLARHFPPTIVDEMASRDDALADVRAQDAAVVFVDIVGFTAHAETARPEAVIETLRGFHAAVEETVFRHGGTLDKFLGDGAMVTFGTPEPRPDDAARAVACIRDLAAIDPGHGLATSVAGHHGAVILGDIGSRRRLEFATVGDTVNVASRLEEATRDLGVGALVSNALFAAAAAPGGWRPLGPVALHKRRGTIEVWTPDQAAASSTGRKPPD